MSGHNRGEIVSLRSNETIYLFTRCLDVKIELISVPILVNTINLKVDGVVKHVDKMRCGQVPV